MLLIAQDGSSGGDRLSDREVYDQVNNILMGGAETTAATLAWALYLIARDPEIERRLHAEVDSVLGSRPAAWDDLPRLELTGRILKETLRLYPPLWMTTRVSTAELSMTGRRFPTGTTFLVSPYALHRRADLFPSPSALIPTGGLMPPSRRCHEVR